LDIAQCYVQSGLHVQHWQVYDKRHAWGRVSEIQSIKETSCIVECVVHLNNDTELALITPHIWVEKLPHLWACKLQCPAADGHASCQCCRYLRHSLPRHVKDEYQRQDKLSRSRIMVAVSRYKMASTSRLQNLLC